MAKKPTSPNPWGNSGDRDQPTSGNPIPSPRAATGENLGAVGGNPFGESADFSMPRYGNGPGGDPFGARPTIGLQQSSPSSAAWAGGAYRPSTPGQSAGAPIRILIGTYVAAMAGLLCALLGKNLTTLVTGWALASIFALAFAMFYAVKNAQLQANPLYIYRPGPKTIYAGGIILALLVIIVSAAQIALHIGRTW